MTRVAGPALVLVLIVVVGSPPAHAMPVDDGRASGPHYFAAVYGLPSMSFAEVHDSAHGGPDRQPMPGGSGAGAGFEVRPVPATERADRLRVRDRPMDTICRSREGIR